MAEAQAAADEAFAKLMGWSTKREVSTSDASALGAGNRTSSLPVVFSTPPPQKATALTKILEQSNSMKNRATVPMNWADLDGSGDKASGLPQDGEQAPASQALASSIQTPAGEAAAKRKADEAEYKEQKRKEAEAAAEAKKKAEAEERERERAIAEAHVQEQLRKAAAKKAEEEAKQKGPEAVPAATGEYPVPPKEPVAAQEAAEEEGSAAAARLEQEKAAVLIQARGRGMLARLQHEHRLKDARQKAMMEAERKAAEWEAKRKAEREGAVAAAAAAAPEAGLGKEEVAPAKKVAAAASAPAEPQEPQAPAPAVAAGGEGPGTGSLGRSHPETAKGGAARAPPSASAVPLVNGLDESGNSAPVPVSIPPAAEGAPKLTSKVAGAGTSMAQQEMDEQPLVDTKDIAFHPTTAVEPEPLQGCWAHFCWLFGVHG